MRFLTRRNCKALANCFKKCRTTTSFRPPTRGFGYLTIMSEAIGLSLIVSRFLMKYDKSPNATYSMTRCMCWEDSLQSINATMCGWCRPLRIVISEVRLSLSFLLSLERLTDLIATRLFSFCWFWLPSATCLCPKTYSDSVGENTMMLSCKRLAGALICEDLRHALPCRLW